MKPVAQELSLHRPALYNPSLWSADELRAYFVARTALLARFVDDIRRERSGTPPQHRLILGMRGMGKSTLLRRLALAVTDDSELNAQWLPLSFPEEQYNVATLADFWLNCLDALGDFLEARGEKALVDEVDAEVERLVRGDSEGALQALLRLAGKLQRRLILLVDNIDLVLDRLKDKHWQFREALQAHPELLLIGASSRALEASYQYEAAFYDFFKVDELRGLTEDEMRETIVNLARLRGMEEIATRLNADRGRLSVLHTLTGGNPRTAVLLYGVLLKGIDGDVRSDLEGLLDEVTPLYKARFEELPPLSQQLLDKLALHWDPMTARQLTDALGWKVNLVSAQLDRLASLGVVEKVRSGSSKRTAFQVGERFFNIWYLMRTSRRVRRQLMWLVKFLQAIYSNEELQSLAKQRLSGGVCDLREAENALALSHAIGRMPVARALETQVLESLLSGPWRDRLGELLDLNGEDRDLLPRAENIRLRSEARTIFRKVLFDEADLENVEQLVGMSVSANVLVDLANSVNSDVQGVAEILREFAQRQLSFSRTCFGGHLSPWITKAIASGEMETVADLPGAEAAALRYGVPALAWITKLLVGDESMEVGAKIELAHEILAVDDGAALVWSCLGKQMASKGDRACAEAAFRRAVSVGSEEADFWCQLGSFLADDPEKLVEAEAAFRRATELQPDKSIYAVALGMFLDKQKRKTQATKLIREFCIAKKPKDPMAWMLLSVVLQGQEGATNEMMSAAKEAVALAEGGPRFGMAITRLSQLLMQQGNIDEAMEAVRQLFDTPSNVSIEDLTLLLKSAEEEGCLTSLLNVLDKSEGGQQFRPFREALAALVAGSADVLYDVAPEVRKPALTFLEAVAPELVEAMS